MDKKHLCQKATEAMRGAYAPYSDYTVGAALLCDDGSIYTGSNVENASYSVTICAERVALFKAVSENHRKFRAIAIAGGKKGNMQGIFSPCGVCRQALSEFCSPDMIVLLVKNENEYEEYSLGQLLPQSFSLR